MRFTNKKSDRSKSTPKWSQKQDQKLKTAVQKHGTQWTFILKRYKFQRSINSLVKRWHGKLKQNANGNAELHKNEEKQENKQENKANSNDPGKRKTLRKGHKRAIFGRITRRKPKVSQRDQAKRQDQSRKQKDQNRMQNSQSSESNSEEDQGPPIQGFEQKYANELKNLVLKQDIMDWQQLALKLGLSIRYAPTLKYKWKVYVYEMQLKKPKKIGGCVKYSEQQDHILNSGIRKGLSNKTILQFLPGRSQYSVEARRSKMQKYQQQTPLVEILHERMMKNALMFMHKRHQHLDKITSDDNMQYESD